MVALVAVRTRVATVDDVVDIARIRMTGWQSAYAGIVPAEVLDSFTLEDKIVEGERWFAQLDAAAEVALVAEDEAGVRGWAVAGTARDDNAPRASGELRAIYVDPASWGRGCGRALLGTAETWLAEAGFASAYLWTFEANGLARAFYEHCGWAADGTRRDIDIRGPIPELRYAKRLAPR